METIIPLYLIIDDITWCNNQLDCFRPLSEQNHLDGTSLKRISPIKYRVPKRKQMMEIN